MAKPYESQRVALNDSNPYGEEYYKLGFGGIPYERNSHWLSFFRGIADRLVASLRPASMFDAGCAWGFLVEGFRDLGVEARGCDISEYAIAHVRPDLRGKCFVGSLADPIPGGPYDLVTCIEVVEHMAPEEALRAITNLTQASNTILFSSTPDDFTEPTHINVRPLMYWLQIFAELGFYPDLLFDSGFLAPHAFLVRKRSEPMAEDALLLFGEVLRGRIDRTAFLQRQTKVEELENETRRLTLELEETRIGLLSTGHDVAAQRTQELNGLRSEVSSWQRKLTEVQSQLTLAASQADEARSQLASATSQVHEVRGQLSESRLRNTEISEELRKAHRAADLLPPTEQQLARVTEELAQWKDGESARALAQRQAERRRLISELGFHVANAEQRTKEAELVISEWRSHCEELSTSTEQLAARRALLERRLKAASKRLEESELKTRELQEALESILASLGWRLAQRGQGWLQKNPLLRYLKPAIHGISRQTKLARPVERIPVAASDALPEIDFLEDESAEFILTDSAIATLRAADTSTVSMPPLAHPEAKEQPTSNGRISEPEPVADPPISYETWISENEPNAQMLEVQRQMGRCFSYRPKISVLVPVYKVPLAVLKAVIESIVEQTYDNWELCFSVPSLDNPEAATFLQFAAARDPRIRVKLLRENEGISGNSNQALTLATGDFLALLDHDDTLAPFAFFEIVSLLNQDRNANFIYSDKDLISEDGAERHPPLFKPQWSPEVMLNANYLTHLCVMRTEHVREVGGWRKETDGAQDWDVFLRVIHRFGNVRHIPKVLYHWRRITTSVAFGGFDAKPYAEQGQVRAVQDHCDALGLEVQVVRHGNGDLRVEWPLQGSVSIIYLSKTGNSRREVTDGLSDGDTKTVQRAKELSALTHHPDYEILVPYGEAYVSGHVRCIAVPPDADVSARIAAAVREATGEILVFIDESVTPVATDWLRELVGPLQIKGVGMVGARLVDQHTRLLRHCGIVFTEDSRVEYPYSGQPEHVYEQIGGASWYRNWSAVSGACCAIRRDVWDKLDGLAGAPLASRPDLHLSLKLGIQAGLRIVYNPYARLLQAGNAVLETSSLGSSVPGVDALFPAGDPYFSPNLTCLDGTVRYRARKRGGSLPAGTDYSADSRALVEIYDFEPDQLRRSQIVQSGSSQNKLERVTWFLPDFTNAFYGGVHTILRFADAFQQQYGVRSDFCIFGHSPENLMHQRIAAAFPNLASSNVFVLNSHKRVNELPESDACVSTMWTTAYGALEFNKTRRKFYLIQDDEPLFYPAGSISALVEATYGFGFRGICNTVSLLDRYEARGGQGEFFSPCIDPTIFHDHQRKASAETGPYTVFCYARPGHARNCFELLGAALRNIKQQLGDQVTLITAGAGWDLKAYQLEGVVENLGLLNYQSTGALYRMCDAGLVMMMTRHPSYLPMELMACGSLVVTNRNPDTAWFLKDGENCLLADLSPSSLAERTIQGLEDAALRRRITAEAKEFIASGYSNWKVPIEKIYRYMLSQC